jgi:hypothetical protein
MATSTLLAAGPDPAPLAPSDPCGVVGTGPGGGSAAIPPGLAPNGSAAGNQAAGFALASLVCGVGWTQLLGLLLTGPGGLGFCGGRDPTYDLRPG